MRNLGDGLDYVGEEEDVRYRVVLVLERYLQAEDLLQEVGAASTVDLMDTGLEIALLVTGRTNVIDVGIEVTLRGTARTVPRSSSTYHCTLTFTRVMMLSRQILLCVCKQILMCLIVDKNFC
ncbi:unnamed protein product [Eruca vesicaria subsp. sativa]|uniref:Uncharacterized protein n=1 Tax=Eruca vesicaria subsp. sativa TaxID=29727 RepID=A0ABC8JQ53_ERUVS|nr:unnamed protein product [Eruca vesicaria subsp. sativa]